MTKKKNKQKHFQIFFSGSHRNRSVRSFKPFSQKKNYEILYLLIVVTHLHFLYNIVLSNTVSILFWTAKTAFFFQHILFKMKWTEDVRYINLCIWKNTPKRCRTRQTYAISASTANQCASPRLRVFAHSKVLWKENMCSGTCRLCRNVVRRYRSTTFVSPKWRSLIIIRLLPALAIAYTQTVIIILYTV